MFDHVLKDKTHDMSTYIGKLAAVIAVVGLLLPLSACRKEQFGLTFNHELHVVENEVECSTCHEQASAGGMSLPDHEVCSVCHEIDVDNPSTDCLQCHNVKTPEEIQVLHAEEPAAGEIIFSHETHTYMDATCEECHIRASVSTSAEDNIIAPMASCLICHDDDQAPQKDCSLCHIASSPVNATHKLTWEIDHGLESRFGGSRCMTCHQEDSCITCHQDKKPRDHNNTWRKITHGAEAAWNRSRCMVCHQEDFCDRCHDNTRPRSHTAGWNSGPMPRHCSQCHIPVAPVNCSVCHEQTPHPSAPASPHPPFEGFMCEECHPTPAGIFPPHQDTGIECTVCHES
jgi:hypothetical protein